jgi:hypothetical protein
MTGGSRWIRAAALLLAGVGGLLLVAAELWLVMLLPVLLGSEGGHMAGDAVFFLVIAVVPLAALGVLVVLSGWRLLRGSGAGVALAVFWTVVGTIASGLLSGLQGSILSAARRIVVDSAHWDLSGRVLAITSRDGADDYWYLDDIAFWIPGIVAVATAAMVVLLLGAFVSQRRQSPGPGGALSAPGVPPPPARSDTATDQPAR